MKTTKTTKPTTPPTLNPDELQQWWMDQAHDEIYPLTAKIVEYGGQGRAIDLIEIGRNLGRLQKREINDAEATELGIYFYLLGKMGRWTAAVQNGTPVSDDTLHDIAIYTKMVQRTRQVGAWPI